eukprot:gb/GECG01010516.1/.p1 GENE.gb/GECG01010516.1/~~gb/GECG01010516.1/.p1  ORF type:complete len:173 (+),score=14.58 gb/GECG01010516.1/:1-519(+)
MKLLTGFLAVLAAAQIASANHNPLTKNTFDAVRSAGQHMTSQVRMHQLTGASSCTSDNAIAKDVQVSLSPSNPKPGDDYTLHVSYDLGDHKVEGGKAVYEAKLNGFPVVDQTDDLCKDLKNGPTPCPLSGQVDSKVKQTVPSDLPHGDLKSSITYKDQDGKEIVCFEIDLSL